MPPRSRVLTHANEAFLFLFTSTIASLTYLVTTFSIEAVPNDFPFGFLEILPPAYWIVLALTLSLLAVAALTQNEVYLWISAILLVVIVAGASDLLHALSRDRTMVVAAERISAKGFFSTIEHGELNFPGSAILLSVLAALTGITPNATVRGFDLLYNPIVLIFAFITLRRLGIQHLPALLGGLVVVFSFYLQGVLIHTTLFGFLFYIMFFGLALGSYSNRTPNVFLLIIFFIAMVISHALSPLLALGGLAATWLGGKLVNKRKGGLPSPRKLANSTAVLTLSFLIFVVYWSYFAYIILLGGLGDLLSTGFATFVLAAGRRVIAPSTVYSRSYAFVTEPYLLIFSVGFAVYLLKVRDHRKADMLFWILGLASTVAIAAAGYVVEIFARIFAFAILPFSYGIAKLLDYRGSHIRAIGIAVLLIALGLHLPAHYGQDSFWTIQESTIYGSQFFGTHSFANASFDSPMRDLRQRFYIDIYRAGVGVSSNSGPGEYLLLNYQGESWILYSLGDDALNKTVSDLHSSHYDTVYSSGWFSIYLEN